MALTKYNEIADLQSQLADNDYDYTYVGIRIMDIDYTGYDAQVGDILPNSYRWNDGEMTDDELDGTCAIDITATLRGCAFGGYSGRRIMIIGGDFAEYGVDPGEIIIRDAVVLQVIDL